MKKLIMFLFIINTCSLMSQTPQKEQNWVKNNTFSDKFDSFKKEIENLLVISCIINQYNLYRCIHTHFAS